MAEEPASPAAPESDGEKFLKTVRDVGFITAVYLYFTGWVYISNYLGAFGLSLKEADIDFYNVITYAVEVFRYVFYMHFLAAFISLCGLVLVAYLLSTYYKAGASTSLAFLKRTKYFFTVPLIFIVLFIIANAAATEYSTEAKVYDTTDLKQVRFIFKDNKDDSATLAKKTDVHASPADSLNRIETAAIYRANEQNKLRLLISNKDTYFVYLKAENLKMEQVETAVPILYLIKKEDVKFVKMSD